MKTTAAPLGRVLFGIALALLVGCGADPANTDIAPTATTIAAPLPREETPEHMRAVEPCDRPDDIGIDTLGPTAADFELDEIVVTEQPTIVTFTTDGTMLIGSRTGVISRWSGTGDPEVVLDLSDDTAAENDQGLLGLTVSPDGAWIYINRTDGDGDSLISAFPVTTDGQVDDDEHQILRVDQPSRLHNGGDLAFAPDGTLYASFGDGGGLGDRFQNAQDFSTVLGAVIRITPRPGEDPPHVAPADNPFVNVDGVDARIWANGVRNPFRFSFDEPTQTLWLADLGQQCIEEINALGPDEAGANLGWNVFEGDGPFLGELAEGQVHRAPEHAYWHTGRWCAVIGGHVYRGEAIESLVGSYVFTDLCGGGIGVAPADGSGLVAYPLPVERPVDITADADGELYIVTIGGPIYRLVPSA